MSFNYDYHTMSEQLLIIGAVGLAAELQGYVVAQLCIKPEKVRQALCDDAQKFLDLEHFSLSEDELKVVFDLIDETRKRLADDQFALQPLIPDDELSLSRRAEELGAWCKGFLHGFGTVGIDKDAEIPTDVGEVLKDFAKICQIDVEEGDTSDASEAHVIELIEYLRTGLYVVQAAYQSPKSFNPKPAKGIH
ncbi:MAG: hypothetical protein ACI93R_001443 [Flavobacteriales bacterium]|jgi:uncharacterized protein YgfB (UPF0149 family)